MSIDFVDFPPPPGPSPVYALVFSLTRHSRGSWSPRKNVNGQLGLLVRFVQSDRFVNFALRNEKINIPDDLVDPRRPILCHLCTEIYINGTLKVL